MMFYAGVGKLGALAVNEVPLIERPVGSVPEAKSDELSVALVLTLIMH